MTQQIRNEQDDRFEDNPLYEELMKHFQDTIDKIKALPADEREVAWTECKRQFRAGFLS